MPSPSLSRDTAMRVSKWLSARERRDEAVALLCVGALSGPNDEEGQKLLAEALRLSPRSTLAKATFERMEGLGKPSAELDQTIAKYTAEELSKLDQEAARPRFIKAQVGFNNNLKYKDKVYHVQTEDSGLERPHIITHLFADGGRVIKSHKRSYADEVHRADVSTFVRNLMKAQHMEMVMALREGRFDDVIAGKAIGGMTLLTEPPQVDVQKLSPRKDKEQKEQVESKTSKEAKDSKELKPSSKSTDGQPKLTIQAADKHTAPSAPKEDLAPCHFRLSVLRSLAGGPEQYEPRGDRVILGSSGGIPLTGEKYCHPREAVFRYRNEELFIEDLEGGNGVFIRIRQPVELESGDEILVGDQLLRVERNHERDDGPDAGPTYFWSSPQGPSVFRVAQILSGGARGAERLSAGTTLQIGSVYGDMIFAKDPFVSEQHCWIEEQAGVIVVIDLNSRTGVFVRIRGEQRLFHGDELIIGRTRVRVELTSYQKRQ